MCLEDLPTKIGEVCYGTFLFDHRNIAFVVILIKFSKTFSGDFYPGLHPAKIEESIVAATCISVLV